MAISYVVGVVKCPMIVDFILTLPANVFPLAGYEDVLPPNTKVAGPIGNAGGEAGCRRSVPFLHLKLTLHWKPGLDRAKSVDDREEGS